jgi:prepilin-type N-terminal cleavage/methylation domain-containing protein
MKRENGFTLVEVTIVMAIMSIVIIMVNSMMANSIDTINDGKLLADMRDEALRGLDMLTADLIESDVDKIDTSYRYQDTLNGWWWAENHFPSYFGAESKQCSNWACPWALNADGTYKEPHAHTTSNFQQGDGYTGVWDMGKNYPASYEGDVCKYDGTPLNMWGEYLDGIKIGSARDIYGNFVTWEGSTIGPDDQSFIFYYPVRNPRKNSMELRRYQVFVSDLFPSWDTQVGPDGNDQLVYNPNGGAQENPNTLYDDPSSPNWISFVYTSDNSGSISDWYTAHPTEDPVGTPRPLLNGKPNLNMIFDGDGDGVYSTEPGQSDADYDYFYVWQDGGPWGQFYTYKQRGTWGSPNYMYVFMVVYLTTGETY